jgi:hypothetical protein
MVTLGVTRPLTLGERIAARDASIALKAGAIALAGLRAKRALRTASSAAGRALVTLASLLAVLTARHGLVLAGLSAFTVAAWQYGTVAGLVMLGVAAFFLELRRR